MRLRVLRQMGQVQEIKGVRHRVGGSSLDTWGHTPNGHHQDGEDPAAD
jgi:hypothetical protein